MSVSDADRQRYAVSYFVPVELQRRQFHSRPIFSELAKRGLKAHPEGVQHVQPWCKWRGISTYLDCVSFAARAADALPTGNDLSVEHATPGQFYSAGSVFFAQAMIDNVADWLSDALALQVKGGERNFRSGQFKREFKKRHPPSEDLLERHDSFITEVNRYRQIWIHSLPGGAMPIANEDQSGNIETSSRTLGVPIDPAISPDEENYRERVERCAIGNAGRSFYPLGEFTTRVFDGASRFYLDWLRFSLDNAR